MSPLVGPGEHMFKLCFRPGGASKPADARWLPGQAGGVRRQLMAVTSLNGSVAGHNIVHDISLDQQHSFGRSALGPQLNVGAGRNGHMNQMATGASATDSSLLHQSALPMSLHDVGIGNSSTSSLLQNVSSDASQEGRQSVSIPHVAQHAAGLQLESQTSSDRIGRVALASEHRKIIQKHAADPAKAVLTCSHYLVYVGTAGQLMQAVQVSDYVPKLSLIPLLWPHIIEQMLVYTFAVSAALALINMAPIWYLDGEAALIEAAKLRGHSDMFYSPAALPPRVWGRLLRLVLAFGTGVFLCVLALHMIRLLGYDSMVGHMLHTLGKLLSFVMT